MVLASRLLTGDLSWSRFVIRQARHGLRPELRRLSPGVVIKTSAPFTGRALSLFEKPPVGAEPVASTERSRPESLSTKSDVDEDPRGANDGQDAAPDVSIVVTTFNRAPALGRCLESLAAQTCDPRLFEVVVVDNNSTDGTVDLARCASARHGNIRHVVETAQGVSNARNRGVREARGNYVGFIDDDAEAAEDWIEQALICFQQTVPRPEVVGGVILPRFLGPMPVWAPESFWTFSWGDHGRFLEPGETFYGSNMFFTKRTLSAVGGFDPAMGVVGNKLMFGDDDAYFARLWALLGAEAHAYYSPQLRVFHGIPPARTTIGYRLRAAFAGGQSVASRELNKLPRRRRTVAVLRLGYRLLREAWRAFRAIHTASGLRHWIARDVASIVARLAALLWAVGLRPKIGRR
ncbi:MAG: hypothetical protein A2W26_08615 [Acidobacteria bacterium RBG_16_64_8]|nr:MAG: hypothetical protein A2W26_08615 [Acidobacteria bacterium RBG_16_64_8]